MVDQPFRREAVAASGLHLLGSCDRWRHRRVCPDLRSHHIRGGDRPCHRFALRHLARHVSGACLVVGALASPPQSRALRSEAISPAGCGRPGTPPLQTRSNSVTESTAFSCGGLAILIGASLALGAARGSAAGHQQRASRRALQQPSRCWRSNPTGCFARIAARTTRWSRISARRPRGSSPPASDTPTWPPTDRAYLVRMVMTRTGLAAARCRAPRDRVIAQARRAIRRAAGQRRHPALSPRRPPRLLAGAAVAWYAAGFGGRHRDGEPLPTFLALIGRACRRKGMPSARDTWRGDHSDRGQNRPRHSPNPDRSQPATPAVRA